MQAGLSVASIQRLLKAAKKIVQHFHQSSLASEALRRKQRENNKPEKGLLQECITRWNSGFTMLEQLLEQGWHVTAVLDEEKRAATSKTKEKAVLPNLKSPQWTLASDLVNVLQPFTVATTFLSTQNNVSLSCVLPLRDHLQASLKPSGKDSKTLKLFKERARDDIRARFGFEDFDLQSVAVLASALDPRFKALNFLSASQGQQVATNVIKLCEEKAEGTEQSEASSTGATGAPPTKKKKPPPPAEPMSVDPLFGPEDKCDTSIPTEVKRYFADPAVSRNEDPLLWWRKNESRFPHIARLSRLFLAVPATPTPSERVFSTAGNIVMKKRSALSPENVDTLIFLNKLVLAFSAAFHSIFQW